MPRPKGSKNAVRTKKANIDYAAVVAEKTTAKEQIEALINKGITEICITDHHDIGYTAMEKADVNTSESTNTSIESLSLIHISEPTRH